MSDERLALKAELLQLAFEEAVYDPDAYALAMRRTLEHLYTKKREKEDRAREQRMFPPETAEDREDERLRRILARTEIGAVTSSAAVFARFCAFDLKVFPRPGLRLVQGDRLLVVLDDGTIVI